MDAGTWILIGALAVIFLLCEIGSAKQRAEIDSKIEEMHGWLKRQHPYRFTDLGNGQKIEYRNNDINRLDEDEKH